MNDQVSNSNTRVADPEEDKKLLAELSIAADDQIVWVGIIVGALMLSGSFIWGAVQFLF